MLAQPMQAVLLRMKDVSDYGYDLMGLTSDPGYDFVQVGRICQRGDEVYERDLIFGGGSWTVLTKDSHLVGHVIFGHWSPIRRTTLRLMMDDDVSHVQSTWSCRHGRDPNDTCCRVCIIFHRNVTT